MSAGWHDCTLPTMPFVGQQLPEGSLQLRSTLKAPVRGAFGSTKGSEYTPTLTEPATDHADALAHNTARSFAQGLRQSS